MIPENRYASCQGREASQYSYLAIEPMNHTNDQQGKTSIRVLICQELYFNFYLFILLLYILFIITKWHSYVGGNQQLSNWTYGPHYRRETMPRTRNFASFPVRSWTLEANLIPYFFLNLIFISTKKCRYRPSSNKPILPAVESSMENHNWRK